MLDQVFKNRLDHRILPSVHSTLSMVVQLHGISGWAAPAAACPGRRANPPRKPNFQTSGYSTIVRYGVATRRCPRDAAADFQGALIRAVRGYGDGPSVRAALSQ
jgi:hypothetical protein